MEFEGVIELVSSDDEAEPPAPKKIKPVPNAMVHIPNKIRDVTINPVSCKNKLSRKLVTRSPNQIPVVTMLRTNCNDRQSKQNVRCIQKVTPLPSSRNPQTDKTLQIQNRLNSYPIKIMNRKPLKVGNWNSVQGISPKLISSLPSGITVTKTCGGSTPNVGTFKNKIRVNKELANNKFGQPKNRIHSAAHLGDILTVELDDDENTSVDKSNSVQWYMRPEEQLDKNKLEEQNNSEPKGREMIEITIEDSPVKPCLIERAKNDTLSITIDDSPVKVLNKPAKDADLGSDTEQDKSKSPHSKKKLEYPEGEKNTEVSMEVDSGIAIENAPKEVENREEIVLTTSTKETNEKDGETCVNKPVLSTIDSIQEENTNQKVVSPKKDNLVDNCNKVEENSSTDNNIDVSDRINGEFNPIFQQFMDLCLDVDKSEDMKTIVEKRIKTYSRQVPKEFVESEQFLDMVSTKITLIKTESSKIFLHIKDIVDELKLHRIRKKATPLVTQNNPVEDVVEDSKYDRKRRRQIRKLEKTLKKLERAINKLDEQEVDFDDEEDSVYLLNDRYKERFVRTYAKFCQLTDTKMLTEPRIVIECRAGQPPGPAKKLEKWINKKVPIGSTLPFPDFHDVIKCVREANTEDKLGWNEADIIDEARDLFTRCGKKLQRRRQENEWRLAASRISQDDPAEKDENLKKKLEENREKAFRKESDLLNKYAQKQNQLHLEPTEIDEKEADNSPVESDDEVDDDSDLLEDSQKRKDRLQRLINEKESMKNKIKNKEQQKDLENNNRLETESLPIKSKENDKETTNVKDQDIINRMKSKEIEEKVEIETQLERQRSAEKVNNTTNVECASEINKDTCVKTKDNFNKQQMLSENFEEIQSDESVEEIVVPPKPAVTNLESYLNEEENIHLICDDFYGDELNLLEKLHSGNETSSPDSSDLDSPIAISDSLDSDSESEHYETYDIISIGNSSCSDTESSEKDKNSSVKNNDTVESVDAVKCDLSNEDQSNRNVEAERARTISINDDDSENIHLACFDDESSKCINIQDDSLSIGETYLGVVENAENTAKHVETNKCEDDISKDDKLLLIIDTIKNSVGCEGETKDRDLQDCDNVIKEIDDLITNNDDGRVKKKSEGDTESFAISKKVIENSICSDVNDGCMTNENMQIDSVPFEMAKDNVTTMETSGDIKLQANEEPMTLIESGKLIVPSKQAEKTASNATFKSKLRKESRETTELDASQVSNIKETSQLRTMEVDKESKIPESGDHVNLELDESILLEDNNETETIGESGERITLEASRESLTLDKNWETLLLEDSRDAEVDEEIAETKTFEASEESRILEASGEGMDQRASGDETMAMNETITFDDDVEPITVEVGEETMQVEDNTEVILPCALQEPDPTTSGVNNNTDST
ncbi:PREDICTED: uncharacterized protein LOC106108024 isoform X2 [Papilio polytes]|uniref:uncharacterized protein LOC106108024 isoform X2 n=1 Tax=Papilio polytes TaxID=76194 RepID=UPI00067699DA|nr:PREDICTED: uncharacterized protein LOC106108024 isoform X2 [Papilio polytes]